MASKNVISFDHIPQQELVQYYQKAKVHILPSWFETTGLSSLEAAAMGCNIVITDKGDTKEYFEILLFTVILRPQPLYGNRRKCGQQSGQTRAAGKDIERYTWKTPAGQTLKAYKKIINK